MFLNSTANYSRGHPAFVEILFAIFPLELVNESSTGWLLAYRAHFCIALTLVPVTESEIILCFEALAHAHLGAIFVKRRLA